MLKKDKTFLFIRLDLIDLDDCLDGIFKRRGRSDNYNVSDASKKKNNNNEKEKQKGCYKTIEVNSVEWQEI